VTGDNRQIFAFSGLLRAKTDKLTNFDLTKHALSLVGKDLGPRVCYVPTAVGDSQDVILVEGGSVVNLVAVWRGHGLVEIMRECWEAGVVLAGASAGSLCWHQGGPTDSFGDSLDPFTEGLGLLPYSNGVHDDFDDQPRRQTYRDLIAKGTLSAGYASEDGVGLHYVGTQLHEAASIRPSARAWWVEADGAGGYTEEPIVPRVL
jgi:peptidase E